MTACKLILLRPPIRYIKVNDHDASHDHEYFYQKTEQCPRIVEPSKEAELDADQAKYQRGKAENEKQKTKRHPCSFFHFCKFFAKIVLDKEMNQRIAHIALVVRDYDEAIAFYTEILGFELLEDTSLTPAKRWVLVSPRGQGDCTLLLAKAASPEQGSCIGNQTGGRVFLFLHTDDFHRDYENLLRKGVKFLRPPSVESYGIVAVFEDLYGNLWDLVQPNPA